MTSAVRRLLVCWLVLMALTAALAFSADVARPSRLSPAWLLAIGAVVILKSRMVLAYYLGLAAAPGALTGFTLAVAAAMAVVVGTFLAVGG